MTEIFDQLNCFDMLSKAEEPFNSYTITMKFLLDAFDAYRRKKIPIPDDLRCKVQRQLLISLPMIEAGLKNIHYSLNADKRVEAQCVLSGLKFIINDLAVDIGDKKEELYDLMSSDIVKDIEEFVDNTVDSFTYEDVELPDLTKVPTTHSWWKHEFDKIETL